MKITTISKMRITKAAQQRDEQDVHIRTSPAISGRKRQERACFL